MKMRNVIPLVMAVAMLFAFPVGEFQFFCNSSTGEWEADFLPEDTTDFGIFAVGNIDSGVVEECYYDQNFMSPWHIKTFQGIVNKGLAGAMNVRVKWPKCEPF